MQDTITARLRGLLSVLPQPDAPLASDDMDLQARAVLAPLIRRAIEVGPSAPAPISPDPTTCPNCGAPASSARTPYCSDACKAESAFVRQFRNSLTSGAAMTPERQIALGEKFWHLLGGLYPRRQAMVPNSSLKQVNKRTEGKCELCGAPATTVDNVGSG